MSIVAVTTVIASLFLVIGLGEPLAARLRLPFSVILAGFGVLLGGGAAFFLRTDLTDALNPAAEAILGLPIRSGLFLYVFLPTLLFQVTLGLNLRRMLDDWAPVLVLAVVAVVVATLSVGYALAWATPLPLMACLLVGAIVSTTDPSAVVGIFRSIAAPRRLSRIIEGESLLNDAAAIALFGLFVGFVTTNVPDPTLGEALARFPWLMAGGALAGCAMATVAVWAMAALGRFELAQLSLSIALPYLAYVATEQLLHASGVIAVVAAGFTVNFTGPGRLAPALFARLRDLWDLLAHWAGGLIFVLAAVLIPRLLGGLRLSDLTLIGVVTAAAILSRAAILFGLLPLLTLLRLSPRVETPYRIAILWGGLRGAVTLALALAVTESAFIPAETKRLVGILATGFTLFTLIVQGSTLRWLIGRLGLDRLSPIDAALADQVIAVALQTVREDVAAATASYGLPREIARAEAKAFAERLDAAVARAEEGADILDRDRVTLGLVALAGAERDMILAAFRDGSLSPRLAERMLGDADRVIEAARAGGRTGWRAAARRSLGYDRGFRLAVQLQETLRIPGPLARRTADRFEILLTQRLILKDLEGFIEGRIRRIHGRRVADLLQEMRERRAAEVADALDGLHLQYPGYAEELDRRFIRRTALRMEEREYDLLRGDGLIGAELHLTLLRGIAAARAALDRRPPLDLALRKAELLRRLPFWDDLDEPARRRLARALTTLHAGPGERLMARDDPARSVRFIASGAVELDTAGQKHRLGPGEMFGHISVLGRRLRSEARALTHCTLLALDETRFLRLLDASPALRAAVEESAAKRGIRLADLIDASRPVAR
jgi:CPA1 family monovalent cation:H+ antiporter